MNDWEWPSYKGIYCLNACSPGMKKQFISLAKEKTSKEPGQQKQEKKLKLPRYLCNCSYDEYGRYLKNKGEQTFEYSGNLLNKH